MVSSLSAAPAISISVGSLGASGIGGHHGSSGGRSASSAAASTSDSPSVVARSSSDEDLRQPRQRLLVLPDDSLAGEFVNFFRPTPSWRSPGRSTCFIACCKLGLID